MKTLLLRVLGLPIVGYFDDFGFFTTAATADLTLQHVTRVCEIFGIALKIAKPEVGAIITFLGLQGTSPQPSPNNDMSIAIRLSHLKATNWADNILYILKDRVLSHTGLESLIGRLNFAQSATFNRFARGILKPLYAMLYARPYCSALCPLLRRTLFWWRATLISLPPRIIADRKLTPGFALFTYASY